MTSLFTKIKNIISYTKTRDSLIIKDIKPETKTIIYFLPIAYLLFLLINKLLNPYIHITWLEVGIISITMILICFIYKHLSNSILKFILFNKKNNEAKIKTKNLITTYFIFVPGNILVISGFICTIISLLLNFYAGIAIFLVILIFLTGFYLINTWKVINNIQNKAFFLKKAILTTILLSWIITNPVVLLSVIPFKYTIADIKITNKNDMKPTLTKRNIVIIDKISGLIEDPGYNEVVLVYYPERKDYLIPFKSLIEELNNNDPFFIKRIIAKQGDNISIRPETKIILNNKQIKTPYLKETENIICQIAFHCKVKKVNKNNYYLLGDNINASLDSRIWSSVDKKYIKGKVFAKIWPLKDFKLIK